MHRILCEQRIMANEIVLYKPNEQFQLEVQVRDETVWLTQQQMAQLFGVAENNITYHIRGIYKTQELEPTATAQKIRVVRHVRAKGVKADIYSGKNLNNMQKLHNTSSCLEPIDVHIWKEASHDSWLIIDDTVYHCGHSLKDMGQKLSAIAQLGVDADDILKKIR